MPSEGAWVIRGQGVVQMRGILIILTAAAAMAQQGPGAGGQGPGTTPPADATKTEEKSPVPSGEQWITGSFDVGYRWVTDIGGSVLTYRTVVNLGDGPKLTGLQFTMTDPKHRLFDRLDARAN